MTNRDGGVPRTMRNRDVKQHNIPVAEKPKVGAVRGQAVHFCSWYPSLQARRQEVQGYREGIKKRAVDGQSWCCDLTRRLGSGFTGKVGLGRDERTPRADPARPRGVTPSRKRAEGGA